MMSQPSVVQLVSAIREQLTMVVEPALEDEGRRKVLGMIDHLLQTIQVRAEHEIEWMVGHTNNVVALAERAVRDGHAAPAVAEALRQYHGGRRQTLKTSDVTADYGLAAEVLSAILESTVSDDYPVAVEARALLQSDIQHGVDIVGEFVLVPP
jgi:hypothetical protein